MKVYIKNMVCDRCRYVIKSILDEMGIRPASVMLGEVDLGELAMNAQQLDAFREKIESLGFELISDKKSRLIENIKKQVLELIQQQEAEKPISRIPSAGNCFMIIPISVICFPRSRALP